MLLSPVANVLTTGLVEAGSYLGRLSYRRYVYELARCRADQTGKPLVVVGAPTHGTTTGSLCQYDCGDLPCVDLGGCERCGAEGRDVEVAGAIPVQNGGAVVCVEYVLEYVRDVDAAWREIRRASGDPSDVFVARVRDFETMTRVTTGARRILDGPPDRDGALRYHDVRAPGRVGRRGEPRRVV